MRFVVLSYDFILPVDKQGKSNTYFGDALLWYKLG